MKAIIQFFINRPLLVNLIMVLVFVVGFLSVGNMRYEYNPKVDMGSVNITTVRAGSGPEDIELAITLPLEEELLKVEGIKKLYSRSMEGVSVIMVRLEVDLDDKQAVLSDIQKAVDRAAARLPNDLIEKPLVEELSTLITPVIEVHVVGDVPEKLLRTVARNVSDGLREVDGIASVIKQGYRRPEVKIQLSPEKLLQLGISHDEIITAVRHRNVRDSGGSVESFTTDKKVVAVGQFSQPKDVANVIIRSAEPGNAVRISDIAEVVEGFEDWQVQSRTDGQLSIAMLARKKASVDELHTAQSVKDYINEIKNTLPVGVELKLVNDMSRLTQNMLDVLVGNALLGLLSVFVILCFSLNIRFAMWVAVGIPFAIILTFLLCSAVGITINSITLTAIILLMGILVDDAVVVSENTQRLREANIPAAQASLQGASEVSQPVIFSALTTMLAFLPLLFMSGPDAAFMVSFPITVILLLAASLFESQCLLPSHLAHTRIKLTTNDNSWFIQLSARYRRFIYRLLRHRYLTITGFILLFIGVLIFGALTIHFDLYPEPDIDTVNIKVELPTGSNFDNTVERVKQIEQQVRAQIDANDLLNINTQIGHHDTDIYGAVEGRNEAWAVISIYLKPVGQRETDTLELTQKLQRWANNQQGYKSLTVQAQTDVPVVGKAVEVEIISNGDERFELATQLQQWLSQQPNVTHSWTSYNPGKDILDLQINYPLLASRNLTVANVTQAVRIALDGELIDELQTLDERVRYRLQLPPSQSSSLDTLENLAIINPLGQAIYLKSVADFKLRPGEADIKHYLGKRTITVYADIDRDASSVDEVNAQVKTFISEQQWAQNYPSVRIWQGGEIEQTQEALKNLGDAYLICILSIFALLIILFNSLLQPLIIMFCLPFGLIGVIIGFGIQDITMGMMAVTGVIGLMGVLVNDSLVLVHTL
ncbi:MAG TPA: efflux RND transporter permease subunit, partial [Porticoccus sp.]|nr:efflux RND transporter permease subunit [Porticoccus sp.]